MKGTTVIVIIITGVIAYLAYRYYFFGYGSDFNYPDNPLKPTNMFGFNSPESFNALTGETTY